ncbi:MAG: hypothetical protein IJW66_01470 [Clostridia bacterium]|nr:hypothetical protein [Clostridia bacterium]
MKKNQNKRTAAPKSRSAAAAEKKRLSESAKNKIIIFSLVGALLLGAIIISIFAIIDYVKRDPNFDYLTADLDRYVYLSEEDYKDYEIKLDIAKPHEIDVDVVMFNLLASNVKEHGSGDSAVYYTTNRVMGAGDHVFIYYRGYLKDKDGNTVEVNGMCNFSSESSQELTLGSGQFVPGFELALDGKNIDLFPKFEKITSGNVSEEMIAYVSYTRKLNGSTSDSDTIKVSNARVDLADASTLNSLGEDFKNYIVGAEIGVKKDIADVKIGSKTYTYKDFKIEFATTCEKPSTNGGKALQVIECYFPYDYGNDGTSSAYLRNETAYFEVYVEKMQDYSVPVLDDDFIKTIVGKEESPITESELNEKYEGENLVEKYKAYVKEFLDKQYEEEYRSMVEDAMWEHYLAKADFKKYPGVKVEPIYKEYVEDVYYQFEQTGGSYQDSLTGEYKTYESVDEFAIAYLKLTYSKEQDWKKVLYSMSEGLVGERLIMYYLIEKLNINVTPELLEKTKADVKQEYLDEYIKQSLEYEKEQDKDFKKPEGEDYDKYVEEKKKELFDYYDDDYFTETAYYEIALDEFIKLPKVITLDERNAYPYPTIK